MQLIQNASQAPQMWSVRFIALAAMAQLAWETLPPESLALIPEDWRGWIVLALTIAAGVSRVIKQELPQ